MSDADQTIGTNRGVSQGANTDLSIVYNSMTTSNTTTPASNSEFMILVFNPTSSFRGNTEGVFYGGMATQTAVSYQLVEG